MAARALPGEFLEVVFLAHSAQTYLQTDTDTQPRNANERADEMHPARLEAVAREVAAETGAAVHVVCGVAELEAQGLNLLAAVGQSARHAPRYVELFYKVRRRLVALG